MLVFDRKRRVRPSATVTAVNAEGLAAELGRRIEGEVRFDPGSRALYATDGSNYRQVPIGVVLPRSKEDIIETVALCREFNAPVLPRGGGTALAGQTCNVAVVVDTTKYMHHVLEIDAERRQARFQPGVYLDDLRRQARAYDLTFAPDPATHSHCALGGMMGNNSCGIHALMGGKTEENTIALEILTYDGERMWVGRTREDEISTIIRQGGRRGEIYSDLKELRDRYADRIRSRFPDIPRRVSGYNLQRLLPEHDFDIAKALVGTEGTCVFILEAIGRLVYNPPARSLLVLGYEDVYAAGDHIMEVLDHGPIGLEGIDDKLIQDMRRKGLHPEDIVLMPEGRGWLLCEFGGDTKEESDEKAHALMRELERKPDKPSMKLFDNPEHEGMVWTIRESGLGATANVPGKALTWPGWEDSAVPPAQVGSYLRALRKLFEKHGYKADLYGHFGQGCIHCRIDFDLFTKEGIEKYRSFAHEAADLVVGYHGSCSGEHGDGQSRAELLPRMFGEDLVEAFREFKQIWDPDAKMNPGKVVNPYRIDQNLRLGATYTPLPVKTHFAYPQDNFSFARATLRCVGVGDCRRPGQQVMCPSYMVTREEMHSTRGRARLLFEMLEGDPLTKVWKSPHVREALDLCLACKGCKGECPVNVDMATYKAEFLAHYYAGRLRPRNAYAIGLIYWWARLASMMPEVANFVTQTPPLSNLMKYFANIHPDRQLPLFARQTFKDWFFARGERNVGKQKVILWTDTWNNHFYPEILKAALEVLEGAGCHVVVARQSVCCGRPLYDYGFLDIAQRLLRQIMSALREELREGTPIVVLEPSCLSVFRDELMLFWPNDPEAKRLSQQTFELSEFLLSKVPGYTPPELLRKCMVHGHCHHKSVLKLSHEETFLKQMKLDYNVLESGCCGMAGGFGFEKDHYEISMQCGQRVLLPEVEQAPKDLLIMTDGFSCREQIKESTDREALHFAQVLLMAQHEGAQGTPGEYPERAFFTDREAELLPAPVRTALLTGAGALLAGGLGYWAYTKWGKKS